MKKKKLKRIDIEMPEEMERLMNKEMEFSGHNKRGIARIAIFEYLRKKEKERKQK